MYEGDAPTAERRAAALSLDRDLLRELLGSEELRELIDPGALAHVCDELQCRSPLTRATGRDELHDVLRQLGDLTAAEVRERVLEGVDSEELLAGLCRERRAIALRVAGERRYVAADDAASTATRSAPSPPAACPTRFSPTLTTPSPGSSPATRAPTGPSRARICARATASTQPPSCASSSARASSPVAKSRPARAASNGATSRSLRRLRRASLAALRKEIEPSAQSALASFLPAWHGIDAHRASGAGIDRLREVLLPLQGLALPAETWERDVLPRRLGAYSQAWLDSLCSSGELVWVGAGPLGRSGRVALYFREDAPLLGPPPGAGRVPAADRAGTAGERIPEPGSSPPPDAARELLRARLLAGPCFFSDLLAELDLPPQAIREALFDLVWAGEATNDSWAPLREPRLSLARSQTDPSARAGRAARAGSAMPGRFGPGRRRYRAPGRGSPHPPGRWSLTEPLFALGADGPSLAERRRALAELLLERHGILTREQVLAERIEGGFAGLYRDVVRPRDARRLSPRLLRRGPWRRAVRAPRRRRAAALGARRAARARRRRPRSALRRRAALARPREREGHSRSNARRPARVPGAHVVLVSGAPALYVERGGRGLIALVPAVGAGADTAAGADAATDERVRTALNALGEAVRAGRIGRLALERIDGEPAIGSKWETLLVEFGFRSGPRRLEAQRLIPAGSALAPRSTGKSRNAGI